MERESFALLQTLPPASFANVRASSARTAPLDFSARLLLHVHTSAAAGKKISPNHAFSYHTGRSEGAASAGRQIYSPVRTGKTDRV